MSSAGFVYLLANTVDGVILDEVPFTDVTFTAGLNAPGGFTAGGLPVSHPLAELLVDDDTPWARSLYIARGNVVHFAGAIVTVEANTDNDAVGVGGQGLLGYYRDGRRSIRSRLGMTHATAVPKGDVSWVGERVDRIVGDLLDHAGAFAGGALPITLTVDGDAATLATTDVTLNGYERKGIGELLDELAGTEPGFAYWLTSGFDLGESPPTLVNELHLRPNTGLLNEVPVVLELGRNATVANLTIDGDPLANDVTATGQGQGERMLTATASAPGSRYPATSAPLLELVVNLSDVKEADRLRSMANAELALRRRPAKVVKLTVREDLDVPLGAFKAGDDVVIDGTYGAIELAGRWRVLSAGATIDADHNLTIDVEAVPSATFDPL